ncbi:MAG TPA: peptidase S8 [Desulfotomaculum sp.]|jgi:subtilisin|nr:peptidase S8 [Desulfotomaculum sp.]HCJ79805.1 peptidase S8 [Desulfotomaculum sp.]
MFRKIFWMEEKSTLGNELIVLLRPGLKTRVVLDLLKRHGAKNIFFLPLISGVVCTGLGEKVLAFLKTHKEVLHIEENIKVKLYPVVKIKHPWGESIFKTKGRQQIIPWGTARIGANKAWPASQGKTVNVAVLDTGIYAKHPDLQANVKGGVNIINSKRPFYDDNGHGTHLAGTIGAVDNGAGIIGVAPQVNLFAVKVLDENGRGSIADIVRGLDWCVQNKMQVVNMSFGSNRPSAALHQAIKAAAGAGIVLVAAAGNDGSKNSVDYPAVYPETIAIGGINERNQLFIFSSQGPEIDLVAPATRVLSTARGGGYEKMSGTSMAATHVTGVAALLIAHNREKDSTGIFKSLKTTAENIKGLKSSQQGAGLVRADYALYRRQEQLNLSIASEVSQNVS